ncbi:MAG: hypothetical protein ABWW70_05660 [Thermoproteota archaeon]
MKEKSQTALIAALQFLHVAGWAAYFALTRQVYNEDTRFLVRLAAAETLPTALGLLGAFAAERWGYRRVISLGVVEGTFLALAGAFIRKPSALLATSFTASLLWSIAGPQIYGYTLTLTSRSGRILGTVLAGSTLGWSVGSLVAPIAAEVLGDPRVVLIAGGVAAAAAYAVLAAIASNTKPSRAGGGGDGKAAVLAALMLTSSLALAGSEIIGSVYMAKLSRELGTVGYSIANSASGFIGAAARPLVGHLVDVVAPSKVLAATLAAYSLYVAALHISHGIVMAVLWVIPLFQLLDTSLYKLSSALVGEARGVAAVNSSYSLAGALVMFLSVLNLGEGGYAVAAALLFLTSSALTLAISRRWYGMGSKAETI